MIIRELRTDDYNTIYGFVVNEMEHSEVLYKDMSASLDGMKADDRYLLVVAEDNNQVVGFVSAVKILGCIDKSYIEITCLVVSSKYQNKGVGKLLLGHIEILGKNSNIEKFSVTSGAHRIGAHDFYRKNGYKDGGFVFYKGQVIIKKD